jgi:hypothetical protein
VSNGTSKAPNRRLSFASDIRPMFTDLDVEHMRKVMDLSNRDSVFAHADAIYQALLSGHMPPPGSGEPRWTSESCEKSRGLQETGRPAMSASAATAIGEIATHSPSQRPSNRT